MAKEKHKTESSQGSRDTKGLTAEKDEFGDWFSQLMIKAELADYTDLSGAIVFRPAAYAIWERIMAETDKRFKGLGIKNSYFPSLIPEKTLIKEQEHLKGFSPEVAWVTHAGDTPLKERLAVRPTSETIMYESYSKWIRSWRDLPLKLNQWNNVVRWEFKHPVPFLRTREFLWNEGHTAYATKAEAEAEGPEIIDIYKTICEEYLALPSLIGRKSEKEKFAGAEYTVSMEFYMPNGKCTQGPDFHHDGQNFARAYDIKFLNKEGEQEYAYQNTFAISTRMLGVMFAVHSDKKGLILPPRIAPTPVVIVPILFDDTKSEVLKFAREIQRKIGEGVILDDREGYTPGFKFNDWELRGIPIRIEIGPKDLQKGEVVLVRRDNGEKETVKERDVKKLVARTLEKIQIDMFEKAKRMLHGAIVRVETMKDVKNAIADKKIAFAPHCGEKTCEENMKFETGGAKVLNIPDEQPALGNHKCFVCKQKAKYFAYVGKSY